MPGTSGLAAAPAKCGQHACGKGTVVILFWVGIATATCFFFCFFNERFLVSLEIISNIGFSEFGDYINSFLPIKAFCETWDTQIIKAFFQE